MSRSTPPSRDHAKTTRLATRTAMLTLVAACWCSSTISAGERVVFNGTKRLSSVVAHLAVAEGYFEDEGLDVEMQYTRGSSILIPSLAHGKIDVISTGPFGVAYINVMQRGARVRFVAARTVHSTEKCSYFAFSARSELIDSGRLKEPDSLRGLRIATDRTSSGYYTWSRLLTSAGLTFDDVELVDLPTAATPDAIAKGLIDVVSQSEPWTTRIVGTGKGRIWKPVSELLPGFQNTFMVFGKRLLDERPDLGQRFMSAYLRAVRLYAEEGKSERIIEIVATQTRLDREELRQMCWPTVVVDGNIDDQGLQEFQEWALAEGLIDAIVPRDHLVDDRFVHRPNDALTTAQFR